MIRLVTFADENMSRARDLCISSAKKCGVDVVYPWGKEMIVPQNAPCNILSEFYQFNKEVLDQPRGSGYWLWKPYIIYKDMLRCEDGDIIIYSDAGVEFVNGVREIIDRMDEDIFFFTNGFPHVEWCKADCLKHILRWGTENLQGTGMDWPFGASGCKQVQASVIFFKVNQKTRDFVKEWLLYCQFPGFIDDSPSKLPNYPTFAEHRHDQAILTCLQIKYGYKLHWWPTQYSEHIRIPGDTYPVIFNHHRKRNNEW